jgi:flagellar motility protein MotE (MotC chaperone)
LPCGSPKQKDLFILSLILIKTLVLFLLWGNLDIPGAMPSSNRVYADEGRQKAEGGLGGTLQKTDASETAYPRDLLLSIQRERDLLKRREEILRKREEQVRGEEARLRRIQREIEERLENLAQIQASLQELIQEKKSLDNEILKKLAKVYESTPPEQAGPMLSRLDVSLAAQILIRMDGRKAGKIWGFVSPERASQISSEISRLQ